MLKASHLGGKRIWQEWLAVGDVGCITKDKRATSITLRTPRLGQVILVSQYGWVDDHDRSMALVDGLGEKLANRGLPWAIMGDFNMKARVMKAWCDEAVHAGKPSVLSPGATCYAGKAQPSSDIDYMVVDKLFAGWWWDMPDHQTSLTTHSPVSWRLK